jgi:hypothetical protein
VRIRGDPVRHNALRRPSVGGILLPPQGTNLGRNRPAKKLKIPTTDYDRSSTEHRLGPDRLPPSVPLSPGSCTLQAPILLLSFALGRRVLACAKPASQLTWSAPPPPMRPQFYPNARVSEYTPVAPLSTRVSATATPMHSHPLQASLGSEPARGLSGNSIRRACPGSRVPSTP